MSELRIEINGLKEEQARMQARVAAMQGEPFLQAMKTATLIVQRGAKINAPVDTGRLRSSITPEIRTISATEVHGVVGSNLAYAPYVELGTRAHFPPPGALAVWARRHGIPEFLVQRAISVRGTKAVHYLENAFREAIPSIVRILEDAVGRIMRSDE